MRTARPLRTRSPFYRLHRRRVIQPALNVLCLLEALKRLGRGCKPRPAQITTKTQSK
jgi:hypothetical protein